MDVVVLARRRRGRWMLTSDQFPTVVTQASSLPRAASAFADAASLTTDTDFDPTTITVVVDLPSDVLERLEVARMRRVEADTAAQRSLSRSKEAARAMAEMGLSLRDIGWTLGLSHQRVAQILAQANERP
jgi:hypothetical protein